MKTRVTVWNENRHEKKNREIAAIYPDGIHGAIAKHLRNLDDIEVRTVTLDDPEQGLPDNILENTDVLIWWGHMAHSEVSEKLAEKIQNRVLRGMGFIALHSSHLSKPFIKLMGTTCCLKWREAGEKERLWVVEPGHPIAEGLGEYFELEHEEMYGERFDIPAPDTTVFISWFKGGEVFRSGCCWNRGLGKVFYFRPGHETYPTYHDPNVLKVIENAVRWAKPSNIVDKIVCPNVEPVEKLN